MISAAKLKYLTNINADEMTELLLDAGYKGRDEPIINTYFAGMELDSDFSIINGGEINFFYQAQYVHVDGGLQFADVIVSFDPVTSAVSADFQS
jgi:hypothetical protein